MRVVGGSLVLNGIDGGIARSVRAVSVANSVSLSNCGEKGFTDS